MSPSKRALSSGLALVVLAGSAAVACGDDEVLGAASSGPEDDAGVVDAPGEVGEEKHPDVPVVTPKRTVFTRNPFGNVAAKDNLIWDGDFEWFTHFAQQYGWVHATQIISVAAFDQVKTGPECRSGMRCGFVTQNQRIAAVGVAPAGNPNVAASVWAKPSTADCADIGAALIACEYAVDPDVPLSDGDNAPDAAGWCHYEAISPPRQRSTCLYLEARFADGEALIDDAVVRRAAPGSVPSRARPDPSQASEIEKARKSIRAQLRPRAERDTPLRQAFQAWLGRPR